MTLQARLVAGFTVLLLVALAALGVVATRSTSSVLLAQADEGLREIQARLSERGGLGAGLQRSGDPVNRGFASLLVDGDGVIVDAAPSGFADDPDPLPDTPSIAPLMSAPGTIATIDSVGGSLEFRAIAVELEGGRFQIAAVPIDDIGAATDELAWWLFAGGAAVAVVGGLATWWTVRRELRPVATMVDTATAIAGGDLNHRIPDPNPATELGRLGGALNDMLTRLDEAFTHERASQEKLNQFVADASHELRTPLAALQGYADLYHKGALDDPADLDEAMTRIRKESGRMRRLVDDLLLLARLDRGQTLERSRVDVASLIRDAIADSLAIEPGRPVSYDGPRSVTIDGDEHRLAQVITNLLANARAHTPAGTPVGVTITGGRGHVVIDVADAGPGIPEEHLAHLFDRFHRGDASRARTMGGAGLGLAIAAAIVTAHGGTIDAANQPDGGACFTLTLPTAQIPAAPPST